MNERKVPGSTFEIPDLEVAVPVSKRTAPAAHRAAPPLTAEPTGFGLEISLPDLDDEGEEPRLRGLDIDLGLAAPGQARRPDENWPHGNTRPADQLPIDSAVVMAIAGYGPAPTNVILSPLYAYRVLSRRSPLKRALAARQGELSQAELARDTQLMQLSNELRPTLEANEAFRRLLDPIRQVEQLAGERGAALAQADAGYREQMAGFDTELLQLQGAEARAQAALAERAQTADASKNELRRAEAKHQRVHIEMRGVLDVARRALGPAGGDLSPAHTAQLAELQERLNGLQPELAKAKATHAAAESAVQQAEAEVGRSRAQIQKLERQKASAKGSLERQLSVQAASVSEAEKIRRHAWAEVARAVLSTRGRLEVPEALRRALLGHDQAVEAAAIGLETHVRALDAYDRERVQQGVILVLSGFGVVLLSILLKAML